MTYHTEKIETAIAKIHECLDAPIDPVRVRRLLKDIGKWSAEAEREAYARGKADAAPQASAVAAQKAITALRDAYDNAAKVSGSALLAGEVKRKGAREAQSALVYRYSCAVLVDIGTALHALKSAPAAEASAKGAGDVDERAAFEAWATESKKLSTTRGTWGGYIFSDTARSWEAWQARAALAAQPAATSAPLQAQTVPSDEVPLPADLLGLIGQYGAARQDSRSDTYALHCWQRLIQGIKQYARHGAQPAASAEPTWALIRDHLGSEIADTLCVTRWKDGIDIQEPVAGLKKLIAACAPTAPLVAHKPDGGDVERIRNAGAILDCLTSHLSSDHPLRLEATEGAKQAVADLYRIADQIDAAISAQQRQGAATANDGEA